MACRSADRQTRDGAVSVNVGGLTAGTDADSYTCSGPTRLPKVSVSADYRSVPSQETSASTSSGPRALPASLSSTGSGTMALPESSSFTGSGTMTLPEASFSPGSGSVTLLEASASKGSGTVTLLESSSSTGSSSVTLLEASASKGSGTVTLLEASSSTGSSSVTLLEASASKGSGFMTLLEASASTGSGSVTLPEASSSTGSGTMILPEASSSIGSGSRLLPEASISSCSSSVNPPESSSSSSNLISIRLNDSKAGMQGLDVERINQIIEEASRGSKFYAHKQESQERINRRVASLKQLEESFTADQISKAAAEMDALAARLEADRDLSRWIVHVDMDAFYAAVEIKDRPELRDVPMAVGGESMLSTSNYAARRFGVRAAMPGFIARKLCPQLVIVPSNFDKYRAASDRVQEVLLRYDPDLSMMSLDEGYLDITDLVNSELMTSQNDTDSPNDVTAQVTSHEDGDGDVWDEDHLVQRLVSRMRSEIFEATELTASAGIACNGMLAKICSDRNKPNGQFFLARCRQTVVDFMRHLPVRKVSGIGPVTSQVLTSLGVVCCGQLMKQRARLRLLFSKSSSAFMLRVTLGVTAPCSERETAASSAQARKSISCESTLSRPTSCRQELVDLLEQLCSQLADDLRGKRLRGRCLTLKLKTDEFRVRSRSEQLAAATAAQERLFSCSQQLLQRELLAAAAGDSPCYRLLGVRMSSLTEDRPGERRQTTLDQVLAGKSGTTSSNKFRRQVLGDSSDLPSTPAAAGSAVLLNPHDDGRDSVSFPCSSVQNLSVSPNGGHVDLVDVNSGSHVLCPVCSVTLSDDSRLVNRHLDECLNQSLVSQLKDDTAVPTPFIEGARAGLKRPAGKSASCPGAKLNKIDQYFLPKP